MTAPLTHDPLTPDEIAFVELLVQQSISMGHTNANVSNNELLALCEMARQAEYGPGTPHQRFQWIHDQLQSLFPDVHNPCQSDPPEPKWIEEIAKLKAERDALRQYLIAAGNATGGFLDDTVSTDFLSCVADNARSHIGKIRRQVEALVKERDEARARADALIGLSAVVERNKVMPAEFFQLEVLRYLQRPTRGKA